MTIVRISKELMAKVDDQIRLMDRRQAEAGHEKKNPVNNPAIVSALVEDAERQWFCLNPALRTTVPREWLVPFERIDFAVALGKRTTTFSVSGQYLAPYSANMSYNSVDVAVDSENLPTEISAALLDHCLEADAHKRRFIEVKQQVREFLENAKSLNDAVKRFPNIALYVPKEFIDKMNTKKAETEKATKHVTVDTSLLSTIGAKHLLGSS